MILDPDRLPFDRYDRLRLMATLIERAATALEGAAPPDGRPNARALDLGGYPGLLADALPEREIWTADVVACDRPRYTRLDGGAPLPFDDGEFDIVVASDVLEHLPEAERAGLLDEAARVARAVVIVSGPFDTPGVAEAEARARAWHERLLGRPYEWLEEHARCGLPGLADTAARLGAVGAAGTDRAGRVSVVAHGDLALWLLMQFGRLTAQALPGTEVAGAAFDRAHNRRVEAGATVAPDLGYRHVLVAEFAGARPREDGPLMNLDGLPVDPESARKPGDVSDANGRVAAIGEGLDLLVEALASRAEAARDPAGETALAAYAAALEVALEENAAAVPSRKTLKNRLGRLFGPAGG